MLIIYSLIILLTFSVFSIIMLNNYRNTQIRNAEIRLFQTANIVADTYKENRDEMIFTRMMVRSYGRQANARILILNSEREVVADNFNDYVGAKVDIKEVNNSLKGESTSNVYQLRDKEVLQLSVPIILNEFGENNIIGAVLVSADMSSINNSVHGLRKDMIKIGSIGLLISLLLTIFATHNLTKPLKKLTLGVEKISEGHLGYTVERNTKDEFGKLIDTFNKMSSTLSNIEKNRKNFINSISHELKTPLTSIKVLIESLSIGNRDVDTYKEYLKDIYSETERMERLVNYLMKSIKLEDPILHVKEEDLSTMLSDTIKLIMPYANRNNVKVYFSNTESIMVRCDRDKVKEVLFNLLDNSIKYRDIYKEENYVSIDLKRRNNVAILKIEDNGIGIDEKNIDDIFNRGFRVLDGQFRGNSRIEGYGIGLAIVKSILDKHRWPVSVKSNLGEGTVFTIEIPTIS